MIDVGTGPPLVLVPGIQARWEWMRPAVAALAEHFRVVTFTLAGERSSRHPFSPRLGFDNFVVQLDAALDKADVASATVCGVSYGGLIALRYAALRPARVRRLVLVSALAPSFVPDPRVAFYARAPRLLLPLFGAAALHRARAEIRAALPGWRERARFAVTHGARVAAAPVSPGLMVERIQLLQSVDFHRDATQVTAPTLVVTGDAALDRTVPVEHTREYLALLPDARHVTLDCTGHLGTVTRPDAFARIDPPVLRGRHGAGGHPPESGELMRREPVRDIAGPTGRLEALLEEPILATGRSLRAAVVFAHPHPLHGGTMHTKAVYRGTKALAALGCAVLRFNFRGVGRSDGSFGNGAGEIEDFGAGLDFMAAHYPEAPLWTAGFSFGAYVSLTAGARDDRVSTLIGIAPALHLYDFAAVKTSAKPK